MARKRQLKRMPVEGEIVVYRIVGTDALVVETLAPWFIPDREDNSKEPDSRERQYPELQDGRSMFATEEQARIRWAGMRKNATQHAEAVVRQGGFIAEVVLQPGQGFDVEDRKRRDGHLTIWGESTKLALAVRRIFRAAR